jgi:hypothetical protein
MDNHLPRPYQSNDRSIFNEHDVGRQNVSSMSPDMVKPAFHAGFFLVRQACAAAWERKSLSNLMVVKGK